MNEIKRIVFQSAMNETVLGYWQERADGRAVPSRHDLDPVIDLRAIAQHLFLVDVERQPLRFRFRLVGTEVVQHVGKDMTGKYLDELVDYDAQYEKVKPDYVTTAETHRPTTRIMKFMTEDGGHFVNYERLLLPLSDDGKTVNMLFGACSPLE